MYEHKALKKFGQNYLADKNILRKIADEVAPTESDTLIEIGPGYGALTSFIIEKCPQMTAVEIDSRVIEELGKKFPHLNIINSDILDFDFTAFSKKANSKIRVVGNIPYNLTSPILFKLVENKQLINDAVFLVQDEVAKRINAKQNTKEYGILAVLLQYFAEIKYCFKVSPNVFIPKPKVNSAVIHLTFKNTPLNAETEKIFIKIVKAGFGNRRKTLKNSLSNSIFKDVIQNDLPIDLSLRAEQLSVNDFIELAVFAASKL